MRIRGNDASIPARRGRQWRFPIELSSNQPRHLIQRFRSQAAGRRPCHELGMEPQSQLAAYTDMDTDKAHELDLGAIPRVHSHPAIRPFDLSAREARTNRDGWPAGVRCIRTGRPARMHTATHLMSSRRAPASNDTRTIDGEASSVLSPAGSLVRVCETWKNLRISDF